MGIDLCKGSSGTPNTPPQSYVRASTLPNDKEVDADDSDDDEPTVQSLPFSVRNLLFNIMTRSPEAAFEYMYGQNRHIFVKLETYIEPSNIVDRHAIAVFIKSSLHYKK